MAYGILVEEAVNHSIIILRNTDTKHEAEIYSFGAILNAFRFPFGSSTINIVEAFPSPAAAQQQMVPLFRSAKLSPFVCRLNKGRYQLNGKEYKIEKFYLQEHALHALLYDATFSIKESVTDLESAAVVLQHHYDGSDNGYPFEFDIEVMWKLSAGNVLTCQTTVSHSNAEAIPYADGWHPYFTLDTNIDDCFLQFDSTAMVEFDAGLIPTGNLIPDDRFSKKTSLDGVFLDNCFVLDPSKDQPRIRFSSDKLMLTILPEPSYPYLQIYTPDDRRSIALENISGTPDCFNNGMGLRMIDPNEKVSFTTHYVPSVL